MESTPKARAMLLLRLLQCLAVDKYFHSTAFQNTAKQAVHKNIL